MTAGRLHRSRDIRAVFAARNAAHGRMLTVRARWGGEGEEPRVAVIAGRDVGSAVRRNRAKRRLRAALTRRGLPPGLDLVVHARPLAVEADFGALRAELDDLIDRALTRAEKRPGQAGGGGRA